MIDAQPSPIVTKIRSIRAAARCARDVRAGTDGDPIAAAQLLATLINQTLDAIPGAVQGPAMELLMRSAPMIVSARLEDPEAFEEVRALLGDLGVPGILDNLPTAWSVPPISMGEAAFGIGMAIGSEERQIIDEAAAPPLSIEDTQPTSLEDMAKAVVDVLADRGVDIEIVAAAAVVDKVLDLLGLEIIEPGFAVDKAPPGGYSYPATPWEMDFAPVPSAQHVDTVPDAVRLRYSQDLRKMLVVEGLHPDAIVHAIFVSDQRLSEIAAVLLSAQDSELLRKAWEGYPDLCGWGPSSDRPFAVWYPVIRSAQDRVVIGV